MFAGLEAPPHFYMDQIYQLIASYRFSINSEEDVQAGIEQLLGREGVSFEREVALAARDRIDFLCAGGCGVEVKTQGARMSVLRQLARYAEHDRITSLLLVTTKPHHGHQAPENLGGKPLRVLVLYGSLL